MGVESSRGAADQEFTINAVSNRGERVRLSTEKPLEEFTYQPYSLVGLVLKLLKRALKELRRSPVDGPRNGPRGSSFRASLGAVSLALGPAL